MAGPQQKDDAGGADAGLQNRNAAGQVVAMQSNQNTAKDAAPEIDSDGNGRDQNGDAGRLLQLDRDLKDVVERDGEDHARAEHGQTYPEPDPERAGNHPAGFFMILLRRPFGNEASDRATQPQIEQVHVGDE